MSHLLLGDVGTGKTIVAAFAAAAAADARAQTLALVASVAGGLAKRAARGVGDLRSSRGIGHQDAPTSHPGAGRSGVIGPVLGGRNSSVPGEPELIGPWRAGAHRSGSVRT